MTRLDNGGSTEELGAITEDGEAETQLPKAI
jgi:hypothetical protein